MEPVDGARDGRQHLRRAVAPRDVRELVQQHRASPVIVPGVGNGGNDDRRRARAECHRHGFVTAAEQTHGSMDAELLCALAEKVHPFRRSQFLRAARHVHDRVPLSHEANDQDSENERVDRE
jgi:hypothetical protein